MLDNVKQALDNALSDSTKFSAFYDNYCMKIQDMDLENEILPLIKRESTDYLSFERKLERDRKSALRKMQIGV